MVKIEVTIVNSMSPDSKCGAAKGRGGEVRYQFYAAVGVDLESFDMFAYSGEQSQTNFLEKHIQDTLIS